jgi:hypothetical protein
LCQPGLSCVAESLSLSQLAITWTCVQAGGYAANQACKPGFPEACASGNYCKTGTGLQALDGTCVPTPAAGEACGSGTSACPPYTVCVSDICQSLALNGVSCTDDAMCYSGKCGTSGGCQPDLPCQ